MRALNDAGLPRLSPAWIVLLAVFAWLAPLGLHEYWFPDEPDVALPVLEMLRRGDFIVPTAMGAPWLDYPPLTYWGGIFWSQFLGATPFALRLTPLIAGGVFLLSTVSIARRIAGPDGAWQTALVGIATPLVWMMATTLQVDMPFAAPQAAGFALYLAADVRQGRSAWLLRAAAFACFGVAILAKGPLGLLLPGFILVLWHASHREWLRILQLAPLALVSLAVAALWYAPLVHRLGAEYVGRELWLQNFDRFGTTTRGHGGKGVFYYAKSLASDLGPWVLLLPAAMCRAWRASRDDRRIRLLAIWFIVSFLFLTAASTKRNVYLLPAYPAILVLLGSWLAANRDARWLRAALWITVALCGVGAVGFAAWLHTPLALQPRLAPLLGMLALPSYALAAVFGLGALAVATLLGRRDAGRAVQALSAMWVVVFTVALWLVMPVIDSARRYSVATAAVIAHSPGTGPVGFFSPGLETTKRAGWLCYLEGRRLEYFKDAADAQAWLAAEPGRVVLSDPTTAPPVPGTVVLERWRLADQDWVVLGAATR